MVDVRLRVGSARDPAASKPCATASSPTPVLSNLVANVVQLASCGPSGQEGQRNTDRSFA